jgi:uncharacterized protein with NAD-binding domain and iron-sulfur cluster
VLPDAVAERDDAEAVVASGAARFLDEQVGRLWPEATAADGRFRWELLTGSLPGTTGTDALRSQYVRANTDPSDRYVQSLPGSGRHRRRADESGYNNLVLAGDWIDTGLNAGCIEAAALSGLQAGNVVLGRRIDDRTTGFRPARPAPGGSGG